MILVNYRKMKKLNVFSKTYSLNKMSKKITTFSNDITTQTARDFINQISTDPDQTELVYEVIPIENFIRGTNPDVQLEVENSQIDVQKHLTTG